MKKTELPQNLEAEQSVIGAILLEPTSIELINKILIPNDFYTQAHKLIFSYIVKIWENGQPIDLVTLIDELNNKNIINEIGGVTYLTTLATSVPTTANIVYYAEIVAKKSQLRQMINLGNTIANNCSNPDTDIKKVISDTEKTIFELSIGQNDKPFKKIDDVLINAYDTIENLNKTKGAITGIISGFHGLDRITSGFQKNDLIIVAARPSVGKTAFCLNIARNAAKNNHKIAVFSLEMAAEQLIMRLISAEGNIESQKLRTGDLNAEDWKKLSLATAKLAENNIYIDDTSGITISDLIAKSRQLKKTNGIDMIIIDYLQLIQGNGGHRGNRQQEVTEISRLLKGLARDLEVPVIALSQLSRNVESRQDKRPIMSDIRESGSIEQDADIVSFLYREDYYDKETENKDIIEIIIAKHRNGAIGDVKLAFAKEYNKFINLNEY